MELAARCLLGQGLPPNVQPELQRGRIMPQICQFIGVKSVTNIEPAKGFMPALIFKFADWFENFICRVSKGVARLQTPGANGFSGVHAKAIWPFALRFKTSGNLPIYEALAT
ncbi:hypothetical protein [Pseudomonas fluorescens]|uniref:hypothetical protein n=1 Tax=Pseudomonas fluorescens TaxID=294 RepID=UPI001BE8C64E|nr:hypothetical protein [Pseudomonas fluorescens]MBT2373996.1 hypothetical protein [Pseudomonas fluorescens]